MASDEAVGPFDPDIIMRAKAPYYALINHIDDCVAHVLERWQEYGNSRRQEPLYVVFSSDHGEMLGDHHLFRKSLGYESSSHVPFFIGGYNVDITPGRCDALCSWEDILPTVADLAGVSLPGPVDGRSLASVLKGKPIEERESLYGLCEGRHANHFLVWNRYKYIWFSSTNEEQVFDFVDDPAETRDLSSDGALLDQLRSRMAMIEPISGKHVYDPAKLVPCSNRYPTVFQAG